MPAMNSAIDTFVVLVLENRSFDHMLGFLRSASYPIDGLTGTESNPIDPHASPPQPVVVTDSAQYYGDLNNPGHSLNPSVIKQLYGLSDAQIERLALYPGGAPVNDGFVYDYASDAVAGAKPPYVPANIMKCFAPAKLPALAGLAQEFAICDHWYSSVPGPTLPNRWFIHCGTSAGYVGGSLKLTALNTIQQLLSMNGHTWKIYYGDIPHALTLMRLWDQPLVQNIVPFDRFAADAGAGTLPNYAFIEPRYLLAPNDQHPPHDVAAGEQLIAGVYNTLRASPQWTRSMLIVTYDEHGGTYDHVSPPTAISPDGLTAYDNDGNCYLAFNFDRLGVRVPSIVVSPYVPKGLIASAVYDHTSILRTLAERFQLRWPLSQRDALANSLAPLAALSAPRTDTPERIDPPLEVSADAVANRPLSDLQRGLLELAWLLPAPEPGPLATYQVAAASGSERAASAYVTAKMQSWMRSR